MSELSRTQFSDSQELVPRTSYLGDTRPNVQIPNIRKAGPLERQSPYKNQRRQQIHDCIPEVLWSLCIASHAFRINQHPSQYSGLH
jgi:hypothetical protein